MCLMVNVCFGQTPTYTFKDLGLMPGSYMTIPNGINSSGQTAETGYFGSGGVIHAGMYSNGIHQDLSNVFPQPTGPGTVNSFGLAINDAGQGRGIGTSPDRTTVLMVSFTATACCRTSA